MSGLSLQTAQKKYPALFKAKSYLLTLSFASILLTAAWAVAATYVYDANGRLVVVKNDAGQAAQYVYDKVGNLIRIERYAENSLVVFGFSPARAATGASVSIQGQGFSATPSQNVVRFNGVQASVVSSTSSGIVTSVPVSATNGPISVTVAGVTAASQQNFIVDENARPPQIVSVGPLIVAQGATVSVVGQNLEPEDGNSVLRLGGTAMASASVSPTAASFVVPSRVVGGKVSVTTIYGTASSSQDVLVLPSGVTAAEISQVVSMSPSGTAVAMSTTGAGKYVAVLFDAVSSNMFSLQFSSMSVNELQIKLYRPDTILMEQRSLLTTQPSFHLPKFIAGGTYLALIQSTNSAASWQMQLEKDKKFVGDLDAFTLSTSVPGQSKRIVYDAGAGSSFGIKLSAVSAQNSLSVDLSSNNRDDYSFDNCPLSSGCEVDAAVKISSTYSLIVMPYGNDTFSATATLLLDTISVIQPSVAYALNLADAGRNARLRFYGTAGEAASIRIATQQTTPLSSGVFYSLLAPDGSFVKSVSVDSSGTLSAPILPTTGVYTVFVDPGFNVTVSASLTLVPSRAAVIAVDGSQENFTTSPGESIRLTFDIGATTDLGIGISNLITPGTNNYALVNVFRADRSVGINTSCNASDGGCELDWANLAAGSYVLVISPPIDGDGTMSFGATLSSDLLIAIQRNVATPVATSRFGQNIRLAFDGAQGESLAVSFQNQTTIPAGKIVGYSVISADGVFFGPSIRSFGPNALINLSNLSNTRTYIALVDPEHGGKISLTANVLQNNVTNIAVGSGSASYSNVAPGAAVYLNFTVQQGANLGVGLTQINAPGTTLNIGPRLIIRTPQGGMLVNAVCSLTVLGCEYDLSNLSAGTYSVEVLPPDDGNGSISFDLAISSDIVGAFLPSTAYPLVASQRGQNARLSFSGVPGQRYQFVVQGASTIPLNQNVFYTFYKPDGSYFTSFSSAGNGTFALPVVPVNGNYSVFIDPTQAASFTASLTLAEPLSDTLVVDGSAKSYNSTIEGAAVYLSFNATQGSNLGLALTNLVTPGSTSNITAYVYNSAGSYIDSFTCSSTIDGCEVDLVNLSAGTYRVEIPAPFDGNRVISFTATLTRDLTGSLARNQQNNVSIGRRGQNARLVLNGTAGESIAIGVSGQTSTPTGNASFYTIYKPDGSFLTSGSITSSGALSIGTLPVSGAYGVYIDPVNGASLSANLAIASGTALIPNGSTSTFTSSFPSSPAYFTFAATQGQNMGIGIRDLITPGTASPASVVVYRPDGSALVSEGCIASNAGCDVDLPNLAAGTYGVVVLAPSNGDGTMNFGTELSSDVTGALQTNVPYSLTIGRRGQNARLTFAGTSGQVVTLDLSGQSTVPASGTASYSVYRPNGVLLTSSSVSTGAKMNLGSLPTTGTYTVVVDPLLGQTLTAEIMRESAATSISNNGSSVAVTTTVAGQIAQLSFTATLGNNLGFGISGLTTTGSTGAVMMQITRPDGSVHSTTSCFAVNTGCQVNLPSVVAGVYRVKLTPPTTGNRTMSLTNTLSSDGTGTLNLNTAVNVNVNRRGKNARYTFTGTAGQNFKLVITSQVTSPAAKRVFYTVLKPDGSSLVSTSSTTSSLTLSIPTLPVNGTYVVFVDPEFGETTTMTLNRQTR